MKSNGDEVVKLGRPEKEDRGEIVRNNGFTERQWEWFQKEAATKGMDTMSYIRAYPITWWINSIEAGRAGSVATPEDDQKFEKLANQTNHKKNRKRKRSNKQ